VYLHILWGMIHNINISDLSPLWLFEVLKEWKLIIIKVANIRDSNIVLYYYYYY
jgi:hypothetical protein